MGTRALISVIAFALTMVKYSFDQFDIDPDFYDRGRLYFVVKVILSSTLILCCFLNKCVLVYDTHHRVRRQLTRES
jgi:hypothetical protein